MRGFPWACLVLVCGGVALAQEPLYMEGATHPGRGQFYLRTQALFTDYKDSSDAGERLVSRTKLVYGIRGNLAALLDADIAHLRFHDSDTTAGLSNLAVRLKYRVIQRDLGPLDTWRTSLFAGADLPAGNSRLAPGHLQPRLGVATTAILGRHGLNGEAAWTRRPGRNPDEFEFNASHLYRIAPVRYAPDTRAAWYTVAESLNTITSHGDYQSDLALGILYEARHWAAEGGVRLPLIQDGPREFRYEAIMGIRYLF